jgi:hypothetical protein
MSKKYYAAVNAYGTSTSVGFCNTWDVYAFGTRASRDAYVESRECENISVRAIKKSEIGKYIDRPTAFSGQRWVIDWYYDDIPSGCLGVVVCDRLDSYGDSRLTVN